MSGSPGLRAARGERLALSYAQERMWFLHRLDPDNPANHLPLVYRLRGRLDHEALRQAFEAVVHRHEILRTVFASTGGELEQQIRAPGPWQLAIDDLSQLDAAARAAELDRRIAAEAHRPFDLAVGPLLRTRLIRLAEADDDDDDDDDDDHDHVLLLTVHHIVFDGRSLGLLWRELAAFYGRYTGRPSGVTPPELAAQYAEYAARERRGVASPRFERDLAYWKEKLGGSLEEIALPFKGPRPAVPGPRVGRASATLGTELWSAARALARRHRTTPFVVLLAAFRAVLARYAGQDDLCIGTVADHRTHADTRHLIGCFINTLALRSSVDVRAPFTALLEQERRTVLEAMAHQEIPFELVIQAVGGARTARGTRLFNVLFVAFDMLPDSEQLAGVVVEPRSSFTPGSQFDLEVSIHERAGELHTWFAYDPDLFDHDTIEQLLAHYRTFVEQAVTSPARAAGELSLMSPAERERVLRGHNATERTWPAGVRIHRRIEAQVDRAPDRVALRFEGESLTYAQLDASANQLAHRLRALGVELGSPVGVLLERSFDMVVTLLGILKAGAAFLPIDPMYPRDRVAAILRDAGARFVVGHAAWAPALDGTPVTCLWLDRERDVLAACPAARLDVDVPPEELAYVLFTSGSTGRPKGVMNRHAGLENRLLWMQDELGLGPDDVVLHKTPFTFDVSVWELFWPLLAGARLVVARPEGHRDPTYLARLMAQERVTTVHFVPAMLEAFLAEAPPGLWASVRRVVSSGEALTGALQARFFACSDAELINLYGPTEAAIDVSIWRCRREDGDRPVPIGHAVANTQLYVLDARLDAVPSGTVGELYIGGVQLARGYISRPDLTAERFVPDPHGGPGQRLYRTGDLARARQGGAIEFLGRVDHQVKLRGFRIELGEIEAVLREQPGVGQCAAVVREDRPGDRQLVAYAVPRHLGVELDRTALRVALAERLPAYMVPSAVVVLAQLPVTSSGKLDRNALPAPGASAYGAAAYVAPVTEVERGLAEIWRELLAIERIGARDDFFDLGGHSLLAVLLVERIRRRFRHALTLRQVFERSTLVAMARQIEAIARHGAEVEVPAPRSTGLQRCRAYSHQMVPWRLYQAAPSNAFTHMVIQMRVRAGADRDLFARVLRALVERHSVLRAMFDEVDGVLMMTVCDLEPGGGPPIEVHDLSAMPPAQADPRMRELLGELTLRPFDLERGWPIRGALVHVPGGSSIAAVVIHHIVHDGQSWALLSDELVRLWTALAAQPVADVDAVLGPRPLQYVDFVDYVERVLGSAEAGRQTAYWRAQLRGAEAPRLPGEGPERHRAPARPGAVWARPGRSVRGAIAPALSEAVSAIARELRASRFATLLAGFAAVLHSVTRQDDIALHSTYMQRFHPELERIIGLMGNPLVMRLRLDERMSYRDLVTQARDIQLAAYEHGIVPIRDWLPPELLRINFNYQFRGRAPEPARREIELQAPVQASDTGFAMPFDLILALQDRERDAMLLLQYNVELLAAEQAEAFVRRYLDTLAALCARPDAPLGEVLPLGRAR